MGSGPSNSTLPEHHQASPCAEGGLMQTLVVQGQGRDPEKLSPRARGKFPRLQTTKWIQGENGRSGGEVEKLNKARQAPGNLVSSLSLTLNCHLLPAVRRVKLIRRTRY